MASLLFPEQIRQVLETANSLAVRLATDVQPVQNGTTAVVYEYGHEIFNMTTPMQQFGFAIVLFFPLLAFICCCLRAYARISANQVGADDILVFISMILSIGETAATYMFMRTNFIGIHFADIPWGKYDTRPGLVWNFVVQVLYNPILALVKTSVLLFLLRLGGQKPGVRVAIHVVNVINIVLMVAIFLVVIFQCWPVAFNWTPDIVGGKCIEQGVFYAATAALTLFTDCLVLALPIWIFADLKMKMKMKIALIIVFIIGFIVTIVGAVRFWFIYQGYFGKVGTNLDPTYTLGFCTSAIETNLAIITASAPALRPLFRQWFPRIFSTNAQNNGSGYPDTYGISGNHRSKITANNHTTASITPGLMLKDLKAKADHKVMRSHSPSASEEEIMTFNGIMRTTAVRVSYADEEAAQHEHNFDSRHHGPNRTTDKEYAMRTSSSGSL